MEDEKKHEKESVLKLRLTDFNFGHYPDLKDPPWGLNEMTWGKYPTIGEAVAQVDELVPGQEEFICNAEANFGDRVVEVRVTILKDLNNHELFYVRAHPV